MIRWNQSRNKNLAHLQRKAAGAFRARKAKQNQAKQNQAANRRKATAKKGK